MVRSVVRIAPRKDRDEQGAGLEVEIQSVDYILIFLLENKIFQIDHINKTRLEISNLNHSFLFYIS